MGNGGLGTWRLRFQSLFMLDVGSETHTHTYIRLNTLSSKNSQQARRMDDAISNIATFFSLVITDVKVYSISFLLWAWGGGLPCVLILLNFGLR